MRTSLLGGFQLSAIIGSAIVANVMRTAGFPAFGAGAHRRRGKGIVGSAFVSPCFGCLSLWDSHWILLIKFLFTAHKTPFSLRPLRLWPSLKMGSMFIRRQFMFFSKNWHHPIFVNQNRLNGKLESVEA